MPPCAQTECDRFTGTDRDQVDFWSASAIFMQQRARRLRTTIAILIQSLCHKLKISPD
jgi:hypothetical protein